MKCPNCSFTKLKTIKSWSPYRVRKCPQCNFSAQTTETWTAGEKIKEEVAAFRNPDPMHVPDEYGITPADREMARQRPARYKQYQERGGALTFREWFDAGMPAGGNNG